MKISELDQPSFLELDGFYAPFHIRRWGESGIELRRGFFHCSKVAVNIGRSSFHEVSQGADEIDKDFPVLELLTTSKTWPAVELKSQPA